MGIASLDRDALFPVGAGYPTAYPASRPLEKVAVIISLGLTGRDRLSDGKLHCGYLLTLRDDDFMRETNQRPVSSPPLVSGVAKILTPLSML
jgi:hypothetical protein